jgi:hypothetical protein
VRKPEPTYLVKLPYAKNVTGEWMYDNIGEYGETWNMSTGHGATEVWYTFLNEEDALLFRLRWM